ncbi:hypothetical protein [Xenorhabdus doucetiae]|uniref:Uncharacterized protein n=2 Tax=Xenorhabdus doucetiae TaxID=351671 RepID=A0A068QTK7_9GAMM|nr:hypothetical protein [Xenorhabdus doucetiae]TYP04089.1 hypothetical protein LY16_02263 [Xenorhabdus doucetiae]CDG18124.1 protein of unknown function [Xenorhabdus doucetiae]
MLIKYLLHDAMRKAQNTFMGYSSNKFHFHTRAIDKINGNEPPAVQELINIMLEKDKQLNKLRANTDITTKIPYHYKYFTENKFRARLVGNCGELANYAFHYLIKKHSFQIFNYYRQKDPDRKKIIYIIMYSAPQPYDHVFISIHYMEDKIDSAEMKAVLSHIQAGSWICDPWAEIVCEGEKYFSQWKNKMEEWYDKKKFVVTQDIAGTIPDTDRYKTLFSPLRPNIFNIVQQNSIFHVSELVFIDQDGNIATLAKDGTDNIIPYDISEIDKSALTSLGLRNINSNLSPRNSVYNPFHSNNLSDITAEKLREKARIYRGLIHMALNKRC